MLEIGNIEAYEAQSRFPEILKRVESGETFHVTSYGRTVAIISAPGDVPPMKVQSSWSRLLQLRNRLGLTPEEVTSSKTEGRP